MRPSSARSWFLQLFTLRGLSSNHATVRVLVFGAIGVLAWYLGRVGYAVSLPVSPFEVAGAVLGMMLAFRTNTAYNRFWEGRTLWGGIVNTCRSLARLVRYYAPQEEAELRDFAVWIVVFAHVTRRRLRGEPQWPEVNRLLSRTQADELAAAHHPALHAAGELSARIAHLLERKVIDPHLATQAELHVVGLVDRLGGVERIMKTPTPPGYVLLLRRMITLYLALLPIALVTKIGLYSPLVTILVAYPILVIESLGSELDEPFGHDVNDLPLSRICETIERDVLPIALQKTSLPGRPSVFAETMIERLGD